MDLPEDKAKFRPADTCFDWGHMREIGFRGAHLRSWAVCGVMPMLGTDGFGRSDTRAALRAFFGVDAKAIAKAAKFALEG
ncbi:MAG: hypothetical protein M9929_14385 [Burkholderiaceae bacterium]|nr:hypothetical protein [Burkholderiaceae bacterium]